MAVRDTMHRAAVWFGLAEERGPYAGDDHDDYEDVDEPVRERPRSASRADAGSGGGTVRRLDTRRRRDEIDDIFADDEPARTSVLRPVGSSRDRPRAGGGGRTGSLRSSQVHLVMPKSFNDAQQVADRFKQDVPVVINLQASDGDLSKRMIDFASGLTYALDGGMQRIAEKVFMLTPADVEISAEERAQLIEKGFFNQS